MKKPITLGKLIIVLFLGYFVGAFFMYIYQYSFNDFWYLSKPSPYAYSAAFGFIIICLGSFFKTMHLILTKSEFIIKLWNYPIIK